MNNKIKITFIIVFILIIVSVAGALIMPKLLLSQQEPDPIDVGDKNKECPPDDTCNFYDCDFHRVYKNCELYYGDGTDTGLYPGFCCNGYTSKDLTDFCKKKDFCDGNIENACENVGSTITTCDMCLTGMSTAVEVLQGPLGCEYKYDVCKIDKQCGEIPEPDENNIIKVDGTECAGERAVGSSWEECCSGKNVGKSRILKKLEDCSFQVVEECTPNDKCAVSIQKKTNSLPTKVPTSNASSTLTPTPTDNPDPINTLTPTNSSVSPTITKSASSNPLPTKDVVSTLTPTATTSGTTTKPAAITTSTQSVTPTKTATIKTNSITPSPTKVASSTSQATNQITPSSTVPIFFATDYPTGTFIPTSINTIVPITDNNHLPSTSLEFKQIPYIIAGLLIVLLGILVSFNEYLQDHLERGYFSLKTFFVNKEEKTFKKRSSKRFENRLTKKKDK